MDGRLSNLPLLLLTLAALALGPLLSWSRPNGTAWRAVLDGASLTLVGGLCLFHLLPHALHEGGWTALAALVVGLVGPSLAHRLPGGRAWSMVWGAAVLVHSAMDGATVAVGGGALSLAVVGHQLPVGLALSTLSRAPAAADSRVDRRTWVALAAIVTSTVLGFFTASLLVGALAEPAAAAVEALVAGGLLHVVLDAHEPSRAAPRIVSIRALVPANVARPLLSAPPTTTPGCDHGPEACGHHHPPPGRSTAWSAVGALGGLAVLAAGSSGDHHGVEHMTHTVRTFGSLLVDAAPALLAGYVLAGLVTALLPAAPPAWLSGGGVLEQAVKGVAFGLPLPVCSCGVLPLYESLIRRGVPATAGLAFLVATPELGIDAVLLSVPLLGGPFAAARVVAAAVAALAVAVVVGAFVPGRAPVVVAAQPTLPLRDRLRTGARFALVELVDHTLPWVLLGVVLAAVAEPLLGHGLLVDLPPALQVPLFAVVGIPLYVCAAGATPIAAVAVHKGVSAGAALAFLLAGPATNVTTFAVLGRLHGRRTAWVFAGAVLAVATAAGWMVDAIGVPAFPAIEDGAHPETHWLGAVAVAAIGVLAVASLFRQGARGVANQIVSPLTAR